MIKRRISGSKSKDRFIYPVLRLSRDYEWLIDKEVEIEFKVVGDRKALVIYVDEKSRVVQLNDNSRNINDRINGLKNNNGTSEQMFSKEEFLGGFDSCGGPAGIRTPDLHLVRVAS